MTWIKGNHTVSFGGLWRTEADNIEELQQAQGSDYWSGAWTGLYSPAANTQAPFTGLGEADMALGLVSYLSNQYNRQFFYFRQSEEGLYAQDVWKINPKLTATAGLRWDRWSPYGEANNRLVAVNLATYANQFQVVTPYNTNIHNLPGIPSSVLASWSARGMTYSNAASTGLPGALFPSNNTDFSPRVGAAWMLNNKTVLRGGFGMYYWTMPLSQILQEARTDPPLNLRFANEVSSENGLNSNFGVATVPTRADYVATPGGTATVLTTGIVPIPTGAQEFMGYTTNNWPDARTYEWNLSLQHQFGQSTVLNLTYIGNHATDLEQRFDLNDQEPIYNYALATGQAPPSFLDALRVNPNWSFSYGALNKTGYENDESVQVEIDRHFTKNLGFQWFYVYTRSSNTTDASGFTDGGGDPNNTSGTCSAPQVNELFGLPRGNISYSQLLRLCYYNSTFVPPQRMAWNFVYQLPFGRGQRFGSHIPKALDTVLGGWRRTGIGTWDHGYWTSIDTYGEYEFANPNLNSGQRLRLNYQGQNWLLWFKGNFVPTQASGVNLAQLETLVPANISQQAVHPLGANFDNTLPVHLANGQIAQIPVSGTYNWSPRANILGPPAWNEDLSLMKYVPLGEHARLRVQGDFFKAFNHPSDVSPSADTGLVNLGEQINAARVIQLSAYIEW